MPPAARRTKSDLVCDGILKNVSDGTWPPGGRLPSESELSELFGVSRISVRKAISQLTGRGILRAVQGGGTYVNEVLPGDYLSNALQMVLLDGVGYREIQEFRLLLEPTVAFQTASRAAPELLAEIEECLVRQEEAERRGDLEQYLREDLCFHNLIAHGTGNGLVCRVMDLLQDLLWLGMHRSGELSGFRDGLRVHREIARCIAQHDAEGARATMWCHIHSNLIHSNLEE